MSTASAKGSAGNEEELPVQSTRETVESVVVAFILAFLFRAFVAEAFVIPTGSMAPTLMGAHKDITCEFCRQQYQASASEEFDSNTGAITNEKTIASQCSTCRGLNAYNFVSNPNHSSFSGDRILVSKFDYVLSSPQRWDVFVFKYPLKAQMNYIKRLVGLPGETIMLSEGDVYIRKDNSDGWQIARKPPDKIQAMKRIVSDTGHQADILVRHGWPSLWQPWAANGQQSRWGVTQQEDDWSARLEAGPGRDWLRYYHRVPDEATWQKALEGDSLDDLNPRRSMLVTDYLAYNSSLKVSGTPTTPPPGFQLSTSLGMIPFLRKVSWQPVDGINEKVTALQYLLENNPFSIRRSRDDGYHWVGDLSAEFLVDVQSDSGTLLLDQVEFGIHFRAEIDVASGEVTLQALDGDQPLALFDGAETVTGQSGLRGAGEYRIEIANFDDQIVLWVNRQRVPFEKPAQFDSHQARSGNARRPYWSEDDPLDAAPIGLGGTDVSLEVKRARVFRDIYYIAVQNSFSDYDLGNFRALVRAIPERSTFAESSEEVLSQVYSHPEWWSETDLFQKRGTKVYQLGEKQYFPMGDNSASSSDARAWFGHHYVEEKYLLGKALLVFWPHTWNRPVPFTPNFRRMGRIR